MAPIQINLKEIVESLNMLHLISSILIHFKFVSSLIISNMIPSMPSHRFQRIHHKFLKVPLFLSIDLTSFRHALQNVLQCSILVIYIPLMSFIHRFSIVRRCGFLSKSHRSNNPLTAFVKFIAAINFFCTFIIFL